MEEMNRMEPESPRFSISGTNILERRNGAFTLVSKILSQADSEHYT